ncbi:phosphoribosylamine--glycine ligase [soil metagenome]
MRTLLIGSGGRENALAWALARSAETSELISAPGNPGMAAFGPTEPLETADPASVVALARRLGAGLVVVGPEAPLVAGVADALRADGRAVFGPDAAAARLEGSKAFAKEVMAAAGVATARWRAFTSPGPATGYLDELGSPYVVKADGLAAGKGVVVTASREEAATAVAASLGGGRRVIVEEHLTGEEVSLIALTDGQTVAPCEPAQDYKRAGDQDQGPNTGGMGSYSPVPSCPPRLAQELVATVLEPVVRVLGERGTPFVGALYAGVMLTDHGPKVLEFNARFGDPETQALLPRLTTDFGAAVIACATGDLAGTRLTFSQEAAVCVVLASGGYPGPHDTGLVIGGVADASALPHVHVFHAGTEVVDGRLVTAGGRVLAVTALGADVTEARARVYAAAMTIDFEGRHLRSDIGLRAARAQAVRS